MSTTNQQQILNCLDHNELVSVIQRTCPPEVYWLFEYLFPASRMRFSDNGVFNLLEIIENTVGPSQFASLCAIKGSVVDTNESISLETVTAPRIFEESHIGVCDTDGLYMTATGQELRTWQQRLDYAQARKANLFVRRLRKRLELMAAELLKYGTLTIDGENVNTTVIDFGRDPDNTIMLDAADQWCAETSQPLDMLDDVVSEIFQCEAEGMVDVLLSQKAWKALRNHKQVMDLFKLQGDNKCTDCGLMLDLFPQGTRILGPQLVGSTSSYNFWRYSKTTNGLTQLDEKDIYLIMNDAFMGIRGYGAIRDMMGLHRETAYFSQKVNRHGIVQEFESRPLPIPGNINATAVIKGVC